MLNRKQLAPLIDFHVHLDLYNDFKNIAKECEQRRIYTLSVTTTPKAWEGNLSAFHGLKYVKPAIGLHPHIIKNISKANLDLFLGLISSAKYIGEIGIDGNEEFKDSIEKQVNIFNASLEIADKYGGKIISVHSKRAASLVLDIIEKRKKGNKYILHWFSGSKIELERAISMGCWFSIGKGMANSRNGFEIIKRIPINKMLTETDGPFVSIKEKEIYPWDIATTLVDLAKIKGVTVLDLRDQIFANLKDVLV